MTAGADSDFQEAAFPACNTESKMTIDAFRSIILDWYASNRRDFPWRNTTDPYAILVSEIMLQQTQTERVIPKYEAWLRRFPDIQTLAQAPLADVLEYWNGLGYNRRARFLQQACQTVVSTYGGVFPESPEELQKLPGIGPYTARAVSCFSYNRPECFIETNIRAVFIFFFFNDSDDAASQKTVSDAQIMPLVKDSVPSPEVLGPREWYYALMDYGAVLKRKTVNPNRRSASYTRQSRFEGSLRQARGIILRQLVKNKDKSLSLPEIQNSEYIEIERLSQAASRLCEERLIIREGDRYRIM